MQTDKIFDLLIVVTPDDCKRMIPVYPRLLDNFDHGKVIFVGRPDIEQIVADSNLIAGKVSCKNEDDIILFDDVHQCIKKRLSSILNGQELPRRATGWYYQQFLKMQYAFECEDEYYMVWDGDTVPCHRISMFSPETDQPYLDLKYEYHPEYFDTMGKILPGFKKVIKGSFISEHMLYITEIMRELIQEIESNDAIPGTRFWEKIINAIEPDKIYDSAFSEFETYGTYIALKHPTAYKLREWHSFRLGAEFFDINTICTRDFEWLGRDFDAISFEKGQSVREDHRGLFDNPDYQQKLSAKKMLQLAQMEYTEGYKEIWDDSPEQTEVSNYTVGAFGNGSGSNNKTLIVIVSYNAINLMQNNIESIRNVLTPGTYQIVVVDNASTDGVDKWLQQQKDIIFVKNFENVGFGPACNQGVKASRGTEFEKADVFLLNNDTRLVFDALYYLKRALYSADDIGAVGSVSNYAGNKQQLDVEFDTVEEYIKFGETINVPMEDALLERVRLSGFSMLVRRNVWDEVGGFDEDFAPGYFEDDALSMEILKRGYRLKVVRNSFVYHAGSQSFIKTDYQTLLNNHHELFIQKYGFDILEYAYASGTAISQIPFSKESRFSVLQYGCGLGSDLKAIKSIFRNAETFGIEQNYKLNEIARKTEKVFGSIDELLEFFDEPSFNVFIIDKDKLAAMNESEQGVLSSLLVSDATVIIKNSEYEFFDYEKIKMIIWDMDETFWQGILSEGEVILPISNADLVRNITDHGVVNSISSKNDEIPVMDELERAGIADLFVFNNINWQDKGHQIAEKISTMGLRPENVLFIDDNPRNLEEAKYYADSLMTAMPDIIPYLTTFYARTIAGDKEHNRLEQYKLLEKKNEARSKSDSSEQFLKDSDIRVVINKDCLEHIDRIHELVMRSNQLNYTKNRDDKKILEKLLTNDWNDSAYIEAKDRFGNYGIIGFYCFDTRSRKMEHLLFSCRVLGMGIEQFIYNKLGCPEFEVKGDVAVELQKDASVDWITEDKEFERSERNASDNRVRILMKGPCDMDSIEPYLAGAAITSEFNFVNNEGFVTAGQNHSMHIWESANLEPAELQEIIDEVPFITADDFKTKLFENEYNVICYSLLPDCQAGLYKRKDKELYISFSSRNTPVTDPECKEGFINGSKPGHAFHFTEKIIDEFAENWEFVGVTPLELVFRNLDYIYDHVKGKPIIILLLGSEVDYEGDNEEFNGLSEYHRDFNPIIREFADDHDRMKVINLTDFVHSQEDYIDSVNHFSRNVYYNVAGEIVRYINENL
ncbi:FkbH-like domain-containing protein [Butyrivibrio fibrisolvens]|uniref:FkbH-like domain-containing protein n=1 Tax=Butyrivibrio fibrisolvens TaxID=831 RepID=A0A1H9TUK4_BUTFI|nr:glycosyltransferase [Butyrivibrio fibrisolvens]SES00671.1 FkbH-like domain-containing protein [Butyrivibrio fibrisolvens]